MQRYGIRNLNQVCEISTQCVTCNGAQDKKEPSSVHQVWDTVADPKVVQGVGTTFIIKQFVIFMCKKDKNKKRQIRSEEPRLAPFFFQVSGSAHEIPKIHKTWRAQVWNICNGTHDNKRNWKCWTSVRPAKLHKTGRKYLPGMRLKVSDVVNTHF